MVDTDPLVWRALVAEVFAEAERRGLGTFTPRFVAAPGKRLLAQAFVDHRCDELARTRLDPESLPDTPASVSAPDGDDGPTFEEEQAVRRAALALLVAVLDGECDARVVDLLCGRQADPLLAVRVAHRLAHNLVAAVDVDDHQEMRDDIAAELLGLAGDD